MISKLTKRPSPILGVTGSMIEEESHHLIGQSDQFAHSFTVNISMIEPDPHQPRRLFDQASLEDMAASFKTVGLLQPLLLRKHPEVRRRWIIVSGERRWRAAQIAGWTEVTAIEATGNIAETALVENIQRSDLTVVEEGLALRKMIDGQSWSQERCAAALGIDASRVSSALHVLTLPQDFLDDVASGAVSVPRNLLVELARIKDATLQGKLISLAREGDLTIRALRAARRVEEAGQGGKPGDKPKVNEVGMAAGLKQSNLSHLLKSLDAVNAGAYKPTEVEIAKLTEIKHALDRIIAGVLNERRGIEVDAAKRPA